MTARPERFGDGYYDRFNTAVGWTPRAACSCTTKAGW